jgi:hypothetical protein
LTTRADYIADAAYQGLAYYTMSSITNDPFKLARMAGYYKGVQSAGGAVSYGMDAVKVGYALIDPCAFAHSCYVDGVPH